MSIKFDPTNSYQSALFFNDVLINVHEELLNFSKKHTTAAQFTGFPLGVCTALLIIAESISTIAESILKGITNIIGSPFSEKCELSRGLKNIVLEFPLGIIVGVFNCTLVSVALVVGDIFFMLINPEETLKAQIDYLKGANERINISIQTANTADPE